MKSFAALLCLMVGFSGLARAQDIEIQADLLSPLGTQTSHKDDKVTAQVTSPDALKGDTLEGKVTDVRSASRLRGSSVLNFTFDTLRHAARSFLSPRKSSRWRTPKARSTSTKTAGPCTAPVIRANPPRAMQ